MLKSALAISAGASAGALLRWAASLALNRLHPLIPLGTLAVNLAGGYMIGFFISMFAANQNISQECRLLVVTGFLGALTTFSTFSMEVAVLLQAQRYGAAIANITLHVAGSILMTFLGMATYAMLKG